jgi:hypothetical protein
VLANTYKYICKGKSLEEQTLECQQELSLDGRTMGNFVLFSP